MDFGLSGRATAKGGENSHSFITAWDGEKLFGMASAISDGHMVMYVSFAAVYLDYQGQGIGSEIMNRLMERYAKVARKVLIALDGKEAFYEKSGL